MELGPGCACSSREERRQGDFDMGDSRHIHSSIGDRRQGPTTGDKINLSGETEEIITLVEDRGDRVTMT